MGQHLRRRRQRLLEPSPVPAACRRQVHRRDGAHALQRPDFGRVAGRQDVLLPESAGGHRDGVEGSAQPVVRGGLLPRQHHALHGVGARLRLRAARRLPVGEPVRREHGRYQDGQRPHREDGAGDALPLGWPRQDDGQPRPGRAVRHPRANSRDGRATNRSRATSTASPTRTPIRWC